MLRKAEIKDINRIAEILIFVKRLTYRQIFKNDDVSFNVMQVGKEIERMKNNLNELDNVYVYDDGIVKATITMKETDDKVFLTEFYVDSFFQSQGIGTKIIKTIMETNADKEIHANPLDKNKRAVEYYERLGFKYTGNSQEFADSGFYMLDYCYHPNDVKYK